MKKHVVRLARVTVALSIVVLLGLFALCADWSTDDAAQLKAEDTATSVDLKPWYIDIDEGREVALATGKPLMIVFR